MYHFYCPERKISLDLTVKVKKKKKNCTVHYLRRGSYSSHVFSFQADLSLYLSLYLGFLVLLALIAILCIQSFKFFVEPALVGKNPSA